jgi:hypothetical protein
MRPTEKQIEAKTAARASAARSALAAAGLVIEEVDALHWRLPGDFLLWPAAGFWRHPDGRPGSGGVAALIAAVRSHSGRSGAA